MFYLLLIVPHLLAIAGLLAFALRSNVGGVSEAPGDRWDGDDGWPRPPAPRPGPAAGGPPLPDAREPRRRVRVGERLSEQHPRRPRREDPPPHPERAPLRTVPGDRRQPD